MRKRPLIALKCLQQALEIQLKDEDISLKAVAETKLNICAVLSGLNKHDIARDFAKGAIENLEELVAKTANSSEAS